MLSTLQPYTSTTFVHAYAAYSAYCHGLCVEFHLCIFSLSPDKNIPTTNIGLSYERPYLVLDLNLISNLHVTQRITLVNWQITLVNQQFTLVNQWFTLVKYLISGLQVLLS